MIDTQGLKKHQQLLWPAAIFLVVLAITFIFIKPKIVSIIELHRQLGKEKAKLAQLTQKVATLESLNEQDLQIKTKATLTALPVEKNVPLFLSVFKLVAQDTGVQLAGIDVTPGELATNSSEIKKQNLPLLTFKLKIKATQGSLRDFLEKLEKTLPIMKASLVSWEQVESEAFEVEIDLDTFFLPLPEQLGLAETLLPEITVEEEKAFQELVNYEAKQSGELPVVPSGRENPFNL